MNKEDRKKKQHPSRRAQPEDADILNPDPAYVTVSNEMFKAAVGPGRPGRRVEGPAAARAGRVGQFPQAHPAREGGRRPLRGRSASWKLLPVLDNFEMGMQAAKTATDAKAIAQGLEMVLAQFQQVLRDAGVETIDAVGPAVRSAPARGAGPSRIGRASRGPCPDADAQGLQAEGPACCAPRRFLSPNRPKANKLRRLNGDDETRLL